jgi:hypothetical protein
LKTQNATAVNIATVRFASFETPDYVQTRAEREPDNLAKCASQVQPTRPPTSRRLHGRDRTHILITPHRMIAGANI